ncbi:major tail protein [Arthrobacter phage Giantsbane]|nr:major tail protein [Arthrobacter phage Giantsbane]
MTKLTWDVVGERFYEAGTDRGVLYLDGVGHVWDGLVAVEQSPSGGEPETYYQDGLPYISVSSVEEFKGSIEAYTYPNAFAACDGSEEIAQGLYIGQQDRKEFGLSYRTLVGNDVEELEHGYKLHIIYQCMASPTNRSYSTLGDSTDASTFNWAITTRPVKFEDEVFGVRYGAHLTLDSREVYPWAMAAVEAVLYGTDEAEPRLPTPAELLTLFIDNAILKITDNGDGTWTADAPDSILTMLTDEIFQINWTSANMIDEDTYTVSTF